MTELENLRLRVARAKRMIRGVLADVRDCRAELDPAEDLSVTTGLDAVTELLTEIYEAL